LGLKKRKISSTTPNHYHGDSSTTTKAHIYHQFSSEEEGFQALIQPLIEDTDLMAKVSAKSDNLCAHFCITNAIRNPAKRLAYIGGRSMLQFPNKLFVQVCLDKHADGWRDVDISRYLRYLLANDFIGSYTWVCVKGYHQHFNVHFYRLGRLFSAVARGYVYVFQAYAIPKRLIAVYKEILYERRAALMKLGKTDAEITKSLEMFSYNTETPGTFPHQLRREFYENEKQAHVCAIGIDDAGPMYLYDYVNEKSRTRVFSIIDIIPYVFEYYRVHVFQITLPKNKTGGSAVTEKV
jgi:hypothetical protein